MAKREALREFQSRLATRLQAAQATSAAASWLAVEAGDGRYLFPLGQAGEIFPLGRLQPLPYTRPWFLGVANLRGGIYGVAQLAALLGDARPSAAFPDTSKATARLVALNEAMDVNCALQIDRLVGLRGSEDFSSVEPPPPESPPWMGHCYLDAAGQKWQEINLQALSQQPEFLNIGA